MQQGHFVHKMNLNRHAKKKAKNKKTHIEEAFEG